MGMVPNEPYNYSEQVEYIKMKGYKQDPENDDLFYKDGRIIRLEIERQYVADWDKKSGYYFYEKIGNQLYLRKKKEL